jgi:hypothetical protein
LGCKFLGFWVYVENPGDFEQICGQLLSQGYEYIFKINTNLDILHITDPSQSKKYKYEECISFTINLSTYINSLNDLYFDKFDSDITEILNLSKMITSNNTDPDVISSNIKMVESYSKCMKSKKTALEFEKINIFNNYVNMYNLQIYKINVVINSID